MMPQNLPVVCTILACVAAKRPRWAPGYPGYFRRPGRCAQRQGGGDLPGVAFTYCRGARPAAV